MPPRNSTLQMKRDNLQPYAESRTLLQGQIISMKHQSDGVVTGFIKSDCFPDHCDVFFRLEGDTPLQMNDEVSYRVREYRNNFEACDILPSSNMQNGNGFGNGNIGRGQRSGGQSKFNAGPGAGGSDSGPVQRVSKEQKREFLRMLANIPGRLNGRIVSSKRTPSGAVTGFIGSDELPDHCDVYFIDESGTANVAVNDEVSFTIGPDRKGDFEAKDVRLAQAQPVNVTANSKFQILKPFADRRTRLTGTIVALKHTNVGGCTGFIGSESLPERCDVFFRSDNPSQWAQGDEVSFIIAPGRDNFEAAEMQPFKAPMIKFDKETKSVALRPIAESGERLNGEIVSLKLRTDGTGTGFISSDSLPERCDVFFYHSDARQFSSGERVSFLVQQGRDNGFEAADIQLGHDMSSGPLKRLTSFEGPDRKRQRVAATGAYASFSSDGPGSAAGKGSKTQRIVPNVSGGGGVRNSGGPPSTVPVVAPSSTSNFGRSGGAPIFPFCEDLVFKVNQDVLLSSLGTGMQRLTTAELEDVVLQSILPIRIRSLGCVWEEDVPVENGRKAAAGRQRAEMILLSLSEEPGANGALVDSHNPFASGDTDELQKTSSMEDGYQLVWIQLLWPELIVNQDAATRIRARFLGDLAASDLSDMSWLQPGKGSLAKSNPGTGRDFSRAICQTKAGHIKGTPRGLYDVSFVDIGFELRSTEISQDDVQRRSKSAGAAVESISFPRGAGGGGKR